MIKWGGGVDSKRSTLVFKLILALFLVFHLAAVVILPMGSGLLNRHWGRFFIGYANTLGFNTTWQFFSPGPSPTFYLEYEFDEGGEDFEESEIYLLPERRTGFWWSDFYNRRLYSMRFLSLAPNLLVQYLVPWLCQKNPKAKAVTVQKIFERITNVERETGGAAEDTFQDMEVKERVARETHSCPEIAE